MVQDFVAPPLRSLKSLLHSLYGFCALKLVRSTCGKSNLNAAQIVNCVYNSLLHYSGTLMKNSIFSSVKICCGVCLNFASLADWLVDTLTVKTCHLTGAEFKIQRLLCRLTFPRPILLTGSLCSPTSAAKILTQIAH